jgi:hypothetical protein
MSGSASIDLERQLLGHSLAIAPMPTVGRVYVALCLSAPTEAAGGTEASGGGYARALATFALMSSPSNAASNATSVEFPVASSAWGTIGYFEIWTVPTGGTRLYWGPLTDPADGVPIEMDVTTGDIVRFSAGTLIVQVAENAISGGSSADDEVCNVKDFGAKGDALGQLDGTMSVGSNVFTSSLATFTAADVGKSIIVTGSGPSNTPRQGTITGYTSAHSITLSFSAAVATPWSIGGVSIGGSFYYGTDDTAAVTAAIAAAQTQQKTAYFPNGCYWLASQTAPIPLSNVALRGEGTGRSFWPFCGGRGSVVLLSNTATAAFSGVAGTSVSDMAFYYPAIDGSQATPISLPPLFEADDASSSNVNNWFSRMRVCAADTVFHATTAGSLARTFMSDCLIYGVRSVFSFHNGYADTLQPNNTYFGPGAMGATATSGAAYLQKHTRANGAVFRYDIGAGNYARADGLIWTGGIVQSYRHAILLTSGLIDVSSVANINFDFIGSVLHVASGARIVSTGFTGGEVYSTNSYDPANADNVFHFAAGATYGSDISIAGMHITFAMGNVVYDTGGALTTLVFSANSVSNWGRTTTAGSYYAYACAGAGDGQQTFTGNTFYGNRLATANAIIGIVTAHGNGNIVITGNGFNLCTRAALLTGTGGSVVIDGNVSTGSAAPLQDSSTASVVYGVNNLDVAPVMQAGGATRGINVLANQMAYLVGASGSHAFSVAGTDRFSVSSTAATVTVPLTINAAGPTIRSGTGAATGTQPKGSLWLRTDGAAGSTLYVTQGGGTWAAVAGV